MATTPVSASNSPQGLAQTLVTKFDRNGDQKLDADEFWSLLVKIAEQLVANAPAASGASGTSTLSATALRTTSALAASITTVGANLPFEGFNFDRVQDPQKSAKDAFAALAKRSTYMPRTKPECEQWFNTFIREGMEELGYTIHWVQGDKFQVTAREGVYNIDFVRAAGGDNPGIQWYAEEA